MFESLSKTFQIQAIYSHQETWNYWTYQRDIEFRMWTKRKQIPWIESVQNGVIRGLKDRDKWGLNWLKLMKTKLYIKLYRDSFVPTLYLLFSLILLLIFVLLFIL